MDNNNEKAITFEDLKFEEYDKYPSFSKRAFLTLDNGIRASVLEYSAEEQERRLRGRGTETEEVIQMRLERAKAEIREAVNYDYIIVNETGKIRECAEEILAIIKAEHRNNARMMKYIREYFGE